MNLYEQMDRSISSPLDQHRIVMSAIARLVDALDVDPGAQRKDYRQTAAFIELKSVLDGSIHAYKRMILGALFRLVDSMDVDSGVQKKDYRSQLETLYASPLMDRYDMSSESRLILSALEIVCYALDTDKGVDDTAIYKTVFLI